MSAQGPELTFLEHLEEMRRRILISLSTLALCVMASFFLATPVMRVLKTLAPPTVRFVQLAPGEVLMASVRLAVFLGFALASPVILYHVLRFVLPGLNRREQQFLFGVVVGGAVLFALGCLFAYYAAIPPAIAWLIEYGSEVAESQISILRFIEFATAFLILIGLMFELPMVLFLLSLTGLVTSAKLLAQWRWALVIIFIVSALVTPSQDPFSMLIVGAAMSLLYLASILPIRLIGK